jgi:competence protein ComEC
MDPSLVYEVGFRLSVAATGGILLLAGPLANRLGFLPRALALAAGVTLAAQVAVTPLLLYHFGVVPAVTVPANLLAFAAVGPAMLLGLVAAGAAALFHPLGLLLGWVARWPLAYLIVLADRLARSPLPSATSPGGGLGELFLGLGAVGVAGWWLHSSRRLPRRAAAVAALIVPLLVWSTALRAGPPSALVVTFFDVGQGDASVVRSPGGAVVLVDAGQDPHQVATELASVGVKHIDLAVATHPHADHIGGFPAVVARYPIGMAFEPGCPEESPFRDAFLGSIRSAGVPVRFPRQGEVLVVRDVRVEVIGPDRCYVGTDSDANNDSLVLRISVGEASILFAGDAEEPAQADLLLEGPIRLHASVLKVPHHGGATSLPEFFRVVRAAVAVVSVGPNRYGHPVPSVLQDLAGAGMRVVRTDHSGDITVSFGQGEVILRTDE